MATLIPRPPLNARSDEALLEFLSTFGFPNRHDSAKIADYPVSMEQFIELKNQRMNFSNILHGLYEATTTDDKRKFEIEIDMLISLDFRSALEKPRATLKARSLAAFMLMELASIAAAGARPSMCQHCGTVFITGPLTGRRSHAVFCSDRCRVAAMRKRKAKATQ